MSQDPVPKSVLVTGANGYIGSAVARAFVRKGWRTYGLVRSKKSVKTLAANEIIPIVGTFEDPSFPFLSKLESEGIVFNVVVSTTEQLRNYIPHYNQIISLLLKISESTKKAGKGKPLVLFTSGCKDYGMMPYLANSPGLQPHTEASPLNSVPLLIHRTTYSIKTLDHSDAFDAAVVRPTNVYGLASSYYAGFFVVAQEAVEKELLEFREDPLTILHAMHVDDCGDAYLALAETGLANREAVKNECFNMSSYRFETLEEIAESLVQEYEIKGGAKFVIDAWPEGGRADENFGRILFGFSQWTSSQKLRDLTGWNDYRPLFSKSLKQYRLAYDATNGTGSELL
ncbi:hypothetical protein BJ875DRAFT_504447 [Amylocarpus encephaloides]|uniref:NAD-dependent epimerase/dehydratase domain-containing protein n=1 Tax=Amylocarpus encephaloides TaxID=45428 RepID=A0A9P7YJ52_9HELO|nr:hypothetical protein BJ875DRAFT_504447 [Amylocarpus encephaloides]